MAKTDDTPVIYPAGDRAAVIEFGSTIDESVNGLVYEFADQLESIEWVSEVVPTYRSLLVEYDPIRVDYDTAFEKLSEIASRLSGSIDDGKRQSVGRVFELPTVYGGEHGPDLSNVAEHAGLTEDQVIELHSGVAYRIYMIGFAPGFPYLGGMNPDIACPRLTTPRTRVPAGSVGIAESQTGVYPNASPGGWQIIGRTPVKLFDPAVDPPSVLKPGEFVRFVPMNDAEFTNIERDVVRGVYRISESEL